MITLAIPINKATSLPGFSGRCKSAKLTRSTSCGLATISFAPLRTAFLIWYPIIGWASVVLVPIARIHLASPISAIELVIAPEPSAMARPATVGACQRRAQ